MKGRKPRAAHLKLVASGKRPIGASAKPRRAVPCPPPPHLSDRAKEVWPHVVAALRGMGVLMPGDLIAVEAFCEAYGDYVGARAAIAARGQHYETRTPSGGIMRRADPAVADMRDADKRLRAWGSELGLSPVSRTRAEKAPTERDALAARYFS